MAKITVHGGPSNAATDEQAAGAVVEGSEQPSASTSSETSSEKEQSSPKPSETPRPKRARTTGNRSAKARTATSTAHPTDGDQEDGTSATDSTSDEAGE
jgi:hypothetical protein